MKKEQGKFYPVWFFLKEYRLIYAALLFTTIGYTILESVNISIFLPLFNSILGKGETTGKIFLFIEGIISFMPFEDRFINIALLAVAILVIKEGLGFARHVLTGYGVGTVVCDVKEKIFNKYINSDYQFFLDNKQGGLIYNLLNATAKLGNCLQYIPEIITAMLMVFTIGALLLSISISITLSLLVIGLAFNVLTHLLATRVSYHIGAERVLAGTKAGVIANEFIDGAKHIKVFNSFGFWKNSFADTVRKTRELVIRDFVWVGIPGRLMQLLPAAMLIGVALFFKYFTSSSTDFMTENLALIGVYLFAFYRLVPFLTSFGSLRMQIMGALPDVETLYDSLHKKTNYITDGNRTIENFENQILFENISFSYKGREGILKNISFTIEKGKTTAIVGASGMGKSTLVNLLVRLYDPDEGRITIDEIDIKELRYSSLTKLMGIVSQDTFIFNASVRENIVFGLKDVSDERLTKAAKLSDAHDFIMSLPNGYETIVGDKGLKLSGGQRQRIAIARAILREPQILILDEATSSLDHNSEILVQNAINKVARNKTVIVIAHRLSTIINADKIVVLDCGRLVEEGIHAELMKRNGTYKFLYESQGRILDELKPEGVGYERK